MRMTVALAVACAIVGLANAQESSAALKQYDLNIPRQTLDLALKDLAQQTGLQIARLSESADGDVVVGPVSGALTPGEALESLLKAQGLTFQVVDGKTIAVVRMGEEKKLKTSGSFKGFRVAEAESATPSESAEGVKLEEIVVTAQKREERLQDVPLSISVVTADDIDKRRLISSEDYLRGTPGVNQMEDVYGQSIVIRGLALAVNGVNYGYGSTVATYFGEVPTTNSSGISGGSAIDTKLIDIERVEVLRGPQGTAFGNSSLGGAVRTIPAAPKTDRFEGKVAASYSATGGEGGGNHMMQGVVNIPLVDNKIAIRASAYRSEDSGYYRNIAGSDASTQAGAAIWGAQDVAVDQKDVGDARFMGARVAAVYQPSDALKFTLTYLTQKTEIDAMPISLAPGYQSTALQVATPEHVRRGQTGGISDTDLDITNAVMEYDLDWASLVTSYSFLKGGSEEAFSLSYLAGFFSNMPLSDMQHSEHREHVGEIRLVTQLDGAWNGLVGLYVEDVEDTGEFNFLWNGDPATDIFAPGERFLGNEAWDRTLKQKAGFAELSWQPLPAVTLTGGVRAYDYERTARIVRTGPILGVPVGEEIIPRGTDATGATYRGNLSYKPNDDSLIYAGWAEGFRLGAPQVGLPASSCDIDNDGIVDGTTSVTIASTRETKSDTVESYEVGGKAAFLNRRLQFAAAVFRVDWQDMPINGTSGSTSCPLFYTVNAGAARSEGVEFQLNAALTPAWHVDAGFSTVHARLVRDAPTLGATAGTRLPGSPDFNANLGIEYGFTVGGHAASVRADAIYVGPFYGNLARMAETRSGDYVKLDLTSRVTFNHLNVDVFVRNLTNVDDFTFRGAQGGTGEFYGLRMRPRTIGLQLAYNF